MRSPDSFAGTLVAVSSGSSTELLETAPRAPAEHKVCINLVQLETVLSEELIQTRSFNSVVWIKWQLENQMDEDSEEKRELS